MDICGSYFGSSGAYGILGAPARAGPFAFTWGFDECIRAWDLRSADTACHLWTAATGNLAVESLAWSEASSALLTATSLKHGVSYGRYGAYRYGERVDSSDEEEDASAGWPKGAARHRGYFPEPYMNDSAAILRYQFDAPPSSSLFARAARALPSSLTHQVPELLQEQVKWERRVLPRSE